MTENTIDMAVQNREGNDTVCKCDSCDRPVIESLQIGITDHCNLGCIMCGQNAHEGYGHPGGMGPPPFHHGKKGFMTRELLEKIVEEIIRDSIRFDVLNFYWFGEQLLHPDFCEMLDFVMDANNGNRFFNRLWINTNATLLDGERAECLLKAANNPNVRPGTFERLYLSIDAASAETFKKIKRREEYDRVMDNSRQFLRLRARGLFPRIVAGFIIMPENAHEAALFRDMWSAEFKSLGLEYTVDYNAPDLTDSDSIFYKVCYLPVQAEMEALHNRVLQDIGVMAPANRDDKAEGIRRETDMLLIQEDFRPSAADSARRPPCPALFRTPTINWDGSMAVCCSDYEMEVALPSLKDMSFGEAWQGERYNRLRKLHCSGRFDEIPRCHACGNLDTIRVSDQELARFNLDNSGEKW